MSARRRGVGPGAPSQVSRPEAGSRRPAGSRDRGFTLLEVVVVLIVLVLGTTLVAPALTAPDRGPGATLQRVVDHARSVATRRGETLVLDVFESGGWSVRGTAAGSEAALDSGVLADAAPGRDFSLRISPFGSCGWARDVDTALVGISVEPLTCRIVRP